MTTRAQRHRTLFAIVLCLVCARAASAQTRERWDVFGGYAYVRDAPDDLSFPIGWAAGASARLNRWLSIVADAGGSYKPLTLVGGDGRITSHSFMAGGRASVSIGKAVEFVHIVAGPVHTRGTAFGLASSDTHLAVQGGIGLDVPLSASLAGRLQLDGRFLKTGHEIRVVAGIVFARR